MVEDEPTYKRQHLVPLVQAFKRNMQVTYDAAGYIKTASLPTPFLIDRLLDARIITADHHFYGVQVIAMRQLFLKDVSVKVGMLRIRSEDGEPQPASLPMEDTDYLKVLRAIRDQRWKEIVMAVCDTAADERLYPQLERIEGTVHMAFGELVEAVKLLAEQKKCREECGETCIGTCRD